MRNIERAALVPLGLLMAGCATQASYVHADATLGRVVVYRNGIAYFERNAKVDGDSLHLAVPGDKVDDFLKSLTVVDRKTGKPSPISYPTDVPRQSKDGLIDVAIGLPKGGSHDLRLSYVTEAPSWKPSYRVVLGKNGKVSVQAYAIVDNTSGEDWQNVELGVGSSSALSFRFDLRSVRNVTRETLHADGLFALAPPTGEVESLPPKRLQLHPSIAKEAIAELDDDDLEEVVTKKADEGRKREHKPPPVTAAAGKSPAPNEHASNAAPTVRGAVGSQAIAGVRRSLETKPGTIVVVEGYGDSKDQDAEASSFDRANRARDELVKQGADPSRVVAVGRGAAAHRGPGVRFVEETPETPRAPVVDSRPPSTEPIGTSHFESKTPMTVKRGTSAMVSILDTETAGEVVYYYDAESARGNKEFPFKAIRVLNPTDSVLESGPFTVFGDGRFVGEGLAEPIPARATAFVPFALDRQIAIEEKSEAKDKIAKIIAVQRGIFSTEVQHTNKTTLVLTNRLPEKARVYVRHTVATGYHLTSPAASEKVGAAQVFAVDIGANDKAELVIEESTPLYRTADIRSPGGMELVSVYLSSAAVEGPLKAPVARLLDLQKSVGNLEQRISTTRETMGEYRARMDELHAQVVTLRAVRSAGPLVVNLEKKLVDVSDRLSKATIALVGLEEELMVSRIKFQDGVAELSLIKDDKSPRVAADTRAPVSMGPQAAPNPAPLRAP
jgi:hypothetical protein